MKSRKPRLQDALKKLSPKERNEAFKWIDNLSEKELKELENSTSVELAQKLLEGFLKKKNIDSDKNE